MSIGRRKRNICMVFANIIPTLHPLITLSNVPAPYPHPSLLLLKLGDFVDA